MRQTQGLAWNNSWEPVLYSVSESNDKHAVYRAECGVTKDFSPLILKGKEYRVRSKNVLSQLRKTER